AGYTCGYSSGQQDCECAPVVGTDFYFEPGAATGLRPTGRLTPPECRFATLQEAIAAAYDAGIRDGGYARAIAVPAPDGGRVIAVGSTQLVIPRGVKLTTSEAGQPERNTLLLWGVIG